MLTKTAARDALGLKSARRHQASMHKIIALSPRTRVQSRRGHSAIVGKRSATIPNTHSKMSVSGDVTEKGKFKDFVTQGRAQREDSLRTGD